MLIGSAGMARFFAALAFLVLLAGCNEASARRTGVSLVSGNPATVGGPADCRACHVNSPSNTTVDLLGPDLLSVGEIATYTLTVTTDQSACGLDVSTTAGLLRAISITNTRVENGELTHNSPRASP